MGADRWRPDAGRDGSFRSVYGKDGSRRGSFVLCGIRPCTVSNAYSLLIECIWFNVTCFGYFLP